MLDTAEHTAERPLEIALPGEGEEGNPQVVHPRHPVVLLAAVELGQGLFGQVEDGPVGLVEDHDPRVAVGRQFLPLPSLRKTDGLVLLPEDGHGAVGQEAGEVVVDAELALRDQGEEVGALPGVGDGVGVNEDDPLVEI